MWSNRHNYLNKDYSWWLRSINQINSCSQLWCAFNMAPTSRRRYVFSTVDIAQKLQTSMIYLTACRPGNGMKKENYISSCGCDVASAMDQFFRDRQTCVLVYGDVLVRYARRYVLEHHPASLPIEHACSVVEADAMSNQLESVCPSVCLSWSLDWPL